MIDIHAEKQMVRLLTGIDTTCVNGKVQAVLRLSAETNRVILLQAYYRHCEAEYDVIGMALCEVAAAKCGRTIREGASVQYAILASLQQHASQLALQFIGCMKRQKGFAFITAMAYYQAGQYFECTEALKKDMAENDELQHWETVHFYLGNCFFRQGKYEEAIQHYYTALEIRESLYEAKYNAQIAVQRLLGDTLGGDILADCFGSQLTLNSQSDELAIKNIPIFINSRDRVGCLQKQIDWLLKHQFFNIYILDNDSTYQPLLDYYESLRVLPSVQVIYLRQNMGHLALFKSGLLEKLHITVPYVYTDSDIIPLEECPSDLLRVMLYELEKNPYVNKVGLSLKLDDISCERREEIIAWEQRFLKIKRSSNAYYSVIDTTFALYRNVRYHTLNEAVRLAYPYQARHIPWYYKKDELPEDEAYYIEHANQSSTFSRFYKKSGYTYRDLHDVSKHGK